MKTRVFSVYDSACEAFMSPFTFQSKGQALRAWQSSVLDPKSPFNKHPGDFTLFEIGTFDDSSGKIEAYEAKLNLGTALEMISKETVAPSYEHVKDC